MRKFTVLENIVIGKYLVSLAHVTCVIFSLQVPPVLFDVKLMIIRFVWHKSDYPKEWGWMTRINLLKQEKNLIENISNECLLLYQKLYSRKEQRNIIQYSSSLLLDFNPMYSQSGDNKSILIRYDTILERV